MVLYLKTRNYHWNIEAPNFNEMHKFYEHQFKELDQILDKIAERTRTIGHYAEARLGDYLKLTNLLEPAYNNFQNDQLKHVLASYETIIHDLRRSIPLSPINIKILGVVILLLNCLLDTKRWAGW
jgi:starvation-inducible DNA-binding protein